MPRRHWAQVNEDRRKTAETISRGAYICLKAVDEVPGVVLFGWQAWKLMGRFASKFSWLDPQSEQSEPLEVMWLPREDAWVEVMTKIKLITTPLFTVLGGLFQGWSGAITSALTDQLTAVGAAALMERQWRRAPTATEPDRVELWWGLSLPDALLLSSFVPLILKTMRSQGVERPDLLS